jgi:hypothetical protein
MTDTPQIVGKAKALLIDWLHEASEGAMPFNHWEHGPFDLMPALVVGDRKVRLGVCVLQEDAEFGQHSPYTPWPINQSQRDAVCDYLLGRSD